MSRKFQHAAAAAVAAMVIFTITSAEVSGAFAQDPAIAIGNQASANAEAEAEGDDNPAIRFVAQEVVQPLPETTAEIADGLAGAGSLAELVASIPADEDMSKDMRCLAGAIYFEARGEPLVGQLAVGQVVVNRAASGKFPETYCGVVYQPSQFSFVRGGRMPSINTASPAWRNARAIARIAHEGLWDSPASEALYFHASYVKPGWRRTRIAQVDSHIFYR